MLTGGRLPASLEDVFTQIQPASFRGDARDLVDQNKSALERSLRDSSSSFKILASRVSMHLGVHWLQKLFKQIDSLLDSDEWDPRDPVPAPETARTFIRLLLVLSVNRKPGIGISNEGNLIAAWTIDNNRLTVECLPGDRVRWIVSRTINDEIERAAGDGRIERLRDLLQPYKPSIWFDYAE